MLSGPVRGLRRRGTNEQCPIGFGALLAHAMAAFLLIVLVTALAVFIGGYLLRDTPIQEVRQRGDSGLLQAGGANVRRLFEVLAQTSLERGNRVELLENGEQLFPRLFSDLKSATHMISWQVFWFKPGEVAQQVADILRERARAGVEVLVLLDYFGSKGLPEEYLEGLRSAGVKARVYRPLEWRNLYRFPHRSHVRSVVIDSRTGYTGGLGIDDRWLGNGREPGQWRDTHVRIEGPAVDQLQAPFIANWAESTGELLFGDGVIEAAEVAGGDSQRAAVMYASPSLGSTGAERYLALTLSAAHETLYITSAYFVPSRGFRHLLCKAASAGVDVRVLTPGRNTDQPSAWYAGRVHYEELLSGGVRIYEYTPTMLHAKTIVADSIWVSVGSINFDNRSLKLNDEVSLVAQDEVLGRAMQEMFLRDLELAEEVVLREFAKRPARMRVRERAAWLITPLL